MLSESTRAAAQPPIATSVIREAAQWLVRLHADEVKAGDVAACARWRAANPAHEEAWQKAERLSLQFGVVPPELGVPVLTRQHARNNRRAVLRTLVALGLLAPAAWLGWRADYVTATGERRDITLADGSRLTLNTDTAVDVVWSDTQRLVRLRRGEVYVRTAPDATRPAGQRRPFVVETQQGRMRALGTRFVVRLLPATSDTAQATQLTVLEHRVEVIPAGGGSPILVDAGQGLGFTAMQSGDVQRNADIATAAGGAPGWTQGVLYADGQRLDAFLAELSRYRPGTIRCAPEVASLRISGAYQLRDTDHVLAILQETLPVQVMLRTRFWVTVVPRGGV